MTIFWLKFGELLARINAKFINPNRLPDCKHGDTAALTHLNGPKVKEELRDALFYVKDHVLWGCE